jgi:hypothetical protein
MEVDMKTQKVLLKSAYCLAGLLILASIGLNIFQYQRNKKLYEKPVPEKITKDESAGKTMSALVKMDQKRDAESATPVETVQKKAVESTAPVKIVQKGEIKSTTPASKEEESNTTEINELEYHLDAAEEEIDMTNEQLDEELSKKEEFKKAYDNFASNPAMQKILRDSLEKTMKQNLDKSYDPLLKKLNFSKEEGDEFKGILTDRMMEIQNVIPPNILAATDEERSKINQQAKEIRDKYDNKISEFLGRENSEIYRSYNKSLSERSSLNSFMETVSPDNRINEKQTETLIDTMYAGRKAVYDEMGPDIDMNSSSNLTNENIARQIEKQKRVYERYMEASRNILPAEQAEQYKAYLKQLLDFSESNLKMRLFMKGNDNKTVND